MKQIVKLLIFLLFPSTLFSQSVYFVDGYHGGIYGHYPLWQTQFMVDKLNEFPEWKINLELEPETWDSVQIQTPDAYLNFKNRVTDARIEFTNPTYAQPYTFNISGESIIRQFEYGIKKIRSHFPDVVFDTYCTEEPCFTSALPQILHLFGFKYAVLKNPDTCWGGYVRGYGKGTIQWVGPDGTSILTVPRYANEAFTKNSTWQTQSWNNSNEYLQSCFDAGIQNPVGMCYQDAGWKNGPWIGYGTKVKNHSIYTTWKDYFSLPSSGATIDRWRLSQEDIQVSLMWGSQVLQRIAQQVRQAENALIRTEKILSMAAIETGQEYPNSLMDEAWRTLMLAQHHDSWIVPYNRLRKNRTWADEIARWTDNSCRLSEQALQCTETTSGNQLRVYNTLPEKRTEIISVKLPDEWMDKEIMVFDPAGKQVESLKQVNEKQADLICRVSVPAFGYTTLRLEEDKTQYSVSTVGITFPSQNECIMENDLYKITFDLSRGGIIKSLIAKKLDEKEFVDTHNTFAFNELRGYFYEKERFVSNNESPARATILEDNGLRKRLKIESKIDEHTCFQIITLNQSQERIDFSLQIDWKGNVGIGEYRQQEDWHDNRRAFYDDRFKLNVLFPLDLSTQTIYKDAPFDVCESQLENTFYNTWDSIKNNILLHWVDVLQGDGAYGLALLSDHTTTYSHGEDFPLGLTAQYSGKGLWGRDYNITQPLSMEYALIPHQGKWDDARIGTQSNAWNEKMFASFAQSQTMQEKSFLQFDKSGYELTSVTPDGDNHLLLRIFNQESDEQPLKIKLNFSDIKEEEISVAIPRFGITTVRIPAQAASVVSLNTSESGNQWLVLPEKEAKLQDVLATDYDCSGWVKAVVPGTVFVAYVEAGLEKDPNFGDNIYQVDKSKYDQNFWYRTEFETPRLNDNEHLWLNLEGINRKGEIYLNGTRLGLLDGFMQRGKFDITPLIHPTGKNVLVVLVYFVGNPVPNYAGPTYISSASWDWMPYVPGLLSGITDDVYLSTSGSVTLVDPWIRTSLAANEARIKLNVELKNNDWKEEKTGIIKGVIHPGNIEFSEKIKIPAVCIKK